MLAGRRAQLCVGQPDFRLQHNERLTMNSSRAAFMLRDRRCHFRPQLVHAGRLEEKDPQAAALGYVADSSKADAKNKHDSIRICSGCALWQSSRRTRKVTARCLLENRSVPKAGAAPRAKKA